MRSAKCSPFQCSSSFLPLLRANALRREPPLVAKVRTSQGAVHTTALLMKLFEENHVARGSHSRAIQRRRGQGIFAPSIRLGCHRTCPTTRDQGHGTQLLWSVIQRDQRFLQLTFQNHASGSVSIRWLNEKLLFGRVWWGRIYSTDFILDVEKEQFIYKQMAHYGEMIEPCR